MDPFAATLAPWQNFYLLTGTAAATLIGLMFVAITFGSTFVTVKNVDTARAFLDPTLTHFVQVLLTACLLVIPIMSPLVLGGVLVGMGLFRMTALVRIYRHMKSAQKEANDIELSDWLTGIIIPFLAHAALLASGGAFLMGRTLLGLVAAVTIVVLLNGLYGAWELMVWMALARARRSE
jgi:hypothetical protein